MTPHRRGGTSTLTCLAKWCVCGVWALWWHCWLHHHLHPPHHFPTPFHCLTSSPMCLSPSIPSTLCLFNPPPVFLVCFVWHCDVAFTLSLWLLMCLCCHLCPPFLGLMVPRFLHCLCAHAFLHCPGPHNNLAPFLCGFWCAPQGTPSISTERGKNGLWCCLAQKVSHERG